MSSKKKVLIITDESKKIQQIAKIIAENLNDYSINISNIKKFSGTDLLPVDYFIIGCEKPRPASFNYLEELLKHINLADRRYSIFSTNEDAINYLFELIKDCEAVLLDPIPVSINKSTC